MFNPSPADLSVLVRNAIESSRYLQHWRSHMLSWRVHKMDRLPGPYACVGCERAEVSKPGRRCLLCRGFDRQYGVEHLKEHKREVLVGDLERYQSEQVGPAGANVNPLRQTIAGLYLQGCNVSEIARRVKRDRKTVREHLEPMRCDLDAVKALELPDADGPYGPAVMAAWREYKDAYCHGETYWDGAGTVSTPVDRLFHGRWPSDDPPPWFIKVEFLGSEQAAFDAMTRAGGRASRIIRDPDQCIQPNHAEGPLNGNEQPQRNRLHRPGSRDQGATGPVRGKHLRAKRAASQS